MNFISFSFFLKKEKEMKQRKRKKLLQLYFSATGDGFPLRGVRIEIWGAVILSERSEVGSRVANSMQISDDFR